MVLLMAFAFLAGAATAVSPCVLPVLPVALSAGVTGGRRRPLGVVTGLALSFTFATVALVYVIDALGLPGGLIRTLAIVVLLVFGLSLLIPPVSARVEAWISRVLPRPRTGDHGQGFASGFLLGLSLGLVYAPCAGPILAGVITVSASQSFTAGRLAVAFSYGVGSAAVLYLVMLGGRRLTSRLTRHGARFQIATGAVMVVVALLMLGDYDTRFQTSIADNLPSFLVNPSKDLEESASAQDRLADLRGPPHGLAKQQTGGPKSQLPVLGVAPDFNGTQRWFNTPGGRPLKLTALRGKVVLVDFWTYTCINCIRTLPYLKAWYRRYHREGLEIVGIHTPEFPFERNASNVKSAVAQNGLHYPVAQDNHNAVWDAYSNQYWPAEYFVDARGRVRYTHFGEGQYEEKEKVIRSLLAEAGRRPARPTRERATGPSRGVTTPESYLGAERAENVANGPLAPGIQDFSLPGHGPPHDALAFGGRWRIAADSATAVKKARIELSFRARRVFLVLGSKGGQRQRVTAKLDGARYGAVGVRSQRLYRLVDLPRVGRHRLTLDLAPGVSAYAFTFG